MPTTLTVEPGFKSTGSVPSSNDNDDDLITIGELARRAGVATSAVRYYERRGLLAPDARRSGQRRYRPATLRRLVFIGMLDDAGLSLDDIDGILDADSRRRLEGHRPGSPRCPRAPDRPTRHARDYLAGALVLPLRPPGHGLLDHGRRDRPPARTHRLRPPSRRVGDRG